MHQASQNSIDSSSLIGFVFKLWSFFMVRALMRMKLAGYLMGKRAFEKKSIDTGFAPVWKIAPGLYKWCGQEWWVAVKEVSGESTRILKLSLEFLLGIREASSSQYFSTLVYTDAPMIVSGIYFLVFHFLKKICSTPTTVILNEGIIL